MYHPGGEYMMDHQTAGASAAHTAHRYACKVTSPCAGELSAPYRPNIYNTPAFLIGVKRNAERYMFSEPRPPVDALRARIRESRFYILQVLPDVNFLVTFAKKSWI